MLAVGTVAIDHDHARVLVFYFSVSLMRAGLVYIFFFFQAEDGIRDLTVTGVQTCALPICCAETGPWRGTTARRSTGCSSTTPWTCFGATGFTWVSRRGGGSDGGGKRARGRRAVAGRGRGCRPRARPARGSPGWGMGRRSGEAPA